MDVQNRSVYARKGVIAQDSVFLEGYSGSFAPEFLQKVILPAEDERALATLEEAEQQNKRLEVKLQASRDSVYPLSVEWDECKVELAESQTNYKCVQETLEFTAGALSIVTEQKLDLEKALAEAQQTIDAYRIAVGNCYSVMSRRHKEVWEAQQTIARQREELTWHGDIGNYEVGNYTLIADDSLDEWESFVLQDVGKRGRAALEIEQSSCCSNPNVQTVNNEFVINTTCCMNCGQH